VLPAADRSLQNERDGACLPTSQHAHAPTADRQPDHTGKEIANVVVRLQTARKKLPPSR
jgi:hypothetical protein